MEEETGKRNCLTEKRMLLIFCQIIKVTLFTLLIFSVLQNAFQETLQASFPKFFKKLARRPCQNLSTFYQRFAK